MTRIASGSRYLDAPPSSPRLPHAGSFVMKIGCGFDRLSAAPVAFGALSHACAAAESLIIKVTFIETEDKALKGRLDFTPAD